ncbi:ROK family protein [Thermodesulfovibrio sp.]|uniref:ROK family protein n=1 Tax=Thermodesulfovibrio sp. TaxID=2067987 RepID=UPI0030B1E5CA
MAYIGVDIGGTYTKIGVVTEQGEVVRLCKFPTYGEPLEFIFEEIDDILNAFTIDGIGVGIAGLVDEEGNVVKASNIPFFNDFPLKKILAERYKMEISVQNDASAATLAEAIMGDGRISSNFILITLGTGIGSGYWSREQDIRFPMEAGHMTINYQGKSCSCGNTGCLEVYASARAIKDNLIEKIEKGEQSSIKMLYEGNFYKVTAEDIYKTALEGDPLCRSVLKEAGKALGAGVANLINIFAPERIIFTGGLSKAVNIYIETAISEAQKRAMKGLKTEMFISSLIDKGGIIGAVAALSNFNLSLTA